MGKDYQLNDKKTENRKHESLYTTMLQNQGFHSSIDTILRNTTKLHSICGLISVRIEGVICLHESASFSLSPGDETAKCFSL